MSNSVLDGIDAALAAVAIGFALGSYFAKPAKLPQGAQLPPGPTPLPLVGNVLAINMETPWVTQKDWASKYGDVVYIRFFGQDNIILNSEQTARDLFEHRSQNYSDRPLAPFAANELFGLDYLTPFMRYGSRWRLHRKILQQSFRQDAVSQFRPMQEVKARELLLNLLDDPVGYLKHLETHSGSVIMSAVYSYGTARRDDRMIEVVKMSLDVLKDINPVLFAIFIAFPSLFRFPSWLPGMSPKRISDLSKKLARDLQDTTFTHTERGFATGSISSCLVADHLLELDEHNNDSVSQKEVIKESAATACVDSWHRNASVLMNFILAMILHPDVQEKAHDLIERVVGTQRLPTFEDRPSLLYVDAILRESLRWYPVTPLGIMHAAVESDIYKGHYIPRGSTVIPNVWAMCRNEEKYPNADVFNPERFLNLDGTLTDDTVSFVWGFGRRVCPGRHLAESSIWSAMACLLAVYKFSKAKDENGKEIEIEPQWKGGFTVRPLPFLCDITPRNAAMDIPALQDLIKAV